MLYFLINEMATTDDEESEKAKTNLQSYLESLLKIDDYVLSGEGLTDDTIAVGVVVVPARQPDIIQPASRLV